VRGCGPKKNLLMIQNEVISALITVAEKVKGHPIAERKAFLRPQLGKIEKALKERFGDSLLLALDHRLEAKSIIVEKCKSMDSKQVPLWLVFENGDPLGTPISVILKVLSLFLSLFLSLLIFFFLSFFSR
jgi:phosphatidylinositol-4,5-bisphosphate 3-kinase catalytic subunit alpha/beta/delta